MRQRRRLVVVLFVLAVLGPVGVASAAGETSGSTPEQVAYGAGSALATVVYAPVNASFCIRGGVAGAFTALASPPTASKVVGGTCRGTWIVTPDVLKGKERVKFVGQ